MFSHDTAYENALSFSRSDDTHLLSTHSKHSFELEDQHWLSAEHYYQSSKFSGAEYGRKIAQAPTPAQACKMGNTWWRKKRGDFKVLRKTLMTRALYSKAIQNSDVADMLLATGDQLLIENSAYEHFWGIGRDQRGENNLGKIWMDIRQKLRDRSRESGTSNG